MAPLPHATDEQAARAIAHVSCVLLAAKNGNQHNENMVVLMDQATAMFQRIAKLEEALKPFASVGAFMTEANGWSDTDELDLEAGDGYSPLIEVFKASAFRKAHVALSKAEGV